MAELERLQAEAQLLQWLQDLDSATGMRSAPSRGKAPDHYLYLLKSITATGHPPQLRMEAVTSAPRVAGGWTKPKPIRTPPRAGNTTYDHAGATDHEVLQLLTIMPGKGYSYYSAYSGLPTAILQGQAGRLALELAASTGRLYSCTDDKTPETPIQWGPARTLDWSWNEVTSTHGSPGWVLRARLLAGSNDEGHESAGAKLLHNDPPYYLDAARGLCGPVQAPGRMVPGNQ